MNGMSQFPFTKKYAGANTKVIIIDKANKSILLL